MNLVWHANGLLEQRWLREMLGEVVTSDVTDLELKFVGDHSIHVVNSNGTPLRACADYFARCRAESSDITLIHLSDEAFDGGYDAYRFFDRVVRQYPAWFVDHPGIMTIPIGYADDLTRAPVIVPADERKNVWAFAGRFKSSRWEMARAMKGLRPNVLVDTSVQPTLGRPAYDALLRDSIFVPCPMGNVVVEATREYEAMELGCIPIVEARRTLDYHGTLLGRNPIPAFRSWPAAADYCRRLIADPAALVEKQREICEWWAGYKVDLRGRISRFLTGPSHARQLQAFGSRWRSRIPPVHAALQIAELLRHQSAMSLVRRVSRPARPVARIVKSGLGR